MSIGRAVVTTFAMLGLTGAMLTATSDRAAALDGSSFDPGYIISDSQFYAGTSMTEAEIQSFLNAQGPATCRPGYTCLKDLRFNSFTKSANPMCGQYDGAANESAARIIAKVGAACGISPKVLLVMLQKEQGLITDTWPTQGQLNSAMGAGCPDTSACDPTQQGFYQQVYLAAYYLIRYGSPPGTGPGTNYTSNYSDRYRPGTYRDVLYQANNPSCGSRNVLIRNQPTASLYWYTPYTPNAAALANLHGVGDSCSAYGNRNFWVYYNNWFGSPTQIAPTNVAVSRLSGDERFTTAVKISQARATATADVVYVASGRNFPDGLSAAPAATLQGAPLLLVEADSIPDVVSAELTRLRPNLIVVVGGEVSVSAGVFSQLQGFASTVRRDGGSSRYETARIIAANAFPAGATPVAYLATGLSFADALAASGAAGARKAPVLLADGRSTTIDPATVATLQTLGVTKLILVGGPAALSTELEHSAADVPGLTVVRLGGSDRFQGASIINREAFQTSPTVYLANGFNFPDALAGAALAGSQGAAMYLSPGGCVYRSTAQDIIDLKATKVVLLGGPAVLDYAVPVFTNCD